MIAPRSSSEVPGTSEEICAQDLRAASANPPDAVLTITEAEEFFSGGVDAREALDIDVPAVGLTPAAELPSVLRCSEYRAGHVPEPLRSYVDGGATSTPKRCSLCGASRLSNGACSLVPSWRGNDGCPDPLHDLRMEQAAEQNKLFSELLFAARDLAEANLVPGVGPSVLPLAWCRECQMNEVGGSIPHSSYCKTGRVMNVVLQLMKAVDGGENSNGEEGGRGQSPEPSCAEGESSPRVDFGEPWGIGSESSDRPASLYDRDGNEVYDPSGATDVMEEEAREYAKRVMLCVNYCTGVDQELMEGPLKLRGIANGGAR